ncbi:MAG: exonuclease SbcCD subunit D [Lachnospiraceae bacterium]|nr:exonuclease SbcCD subunit D [Lachnospiraceae bacterium]
MRFFHLSDLHIGKHLHYYNLAKDQEMILSQIVERAEEYRPDAIIIAGDIYDKTVPSGEAYQLFDAFLNQLSELSPVIPVMIIAGNHDSADRLQYASAFLEKHQIYVSVMPPLAQEEYLKKITLKDEYGEVDFYLFPFMKPGYVRHLFEDENISDYETAFRLMLEREALDATRRQVLVAHQFFVNAGQAPETCDSEQLSIVVGGLDAIDISVVKDFDYVALGHIHGAQKLGDGKVRYCGTPLKYSVSEEKHRKSISLVTLGEKGTDLQVEEIPLEPMREVRRIKGQLSEVMGAATQENRHDYVSITLTDDKETFHQKELLEEVYDHILEVIVDNARTRNILEQMSGEEKLQTPLEAFREFYQMMQQQTLSAEEEEIMQQVMEKIDYEAN